VELLSPGLAAVVTAASVRLRVRDPRAVKAVIDDASSTISSLLGLPLGARAVAHGELATVLPVLIVVAAVARVARVARSELELRTGVALRELRADGVDETVSKGVDRVNALKSNVPVIGKLTVVLGGSLVNRQALRDGGGDSTGKIDARDAIARDRAALSLEIVLVATVDVNAIAIRVTASLVAINSALTVGAVSVSGDGVKGTELEGSRVNVDPDTARVVDVHVVPVALDGVAGNSGVHVVVLGIDLPETVIGDLELVGEVTGVIRVVITSDRVRRSKGGRVGEVVVVVGGPVIKRDLVTIAESGAGKLDSRESSASKTSGVHLSSLAASVTGSSRTTAEELRLFATVPRVSVAIVPAVVAGERASTLTSITGGGALNLVGGSSLRSDVGMDAGEETDDLAIKSGLSELTPVDHSEIAVPEGLNTNGALVLTEKVEPAAVGRNIVVDRLVGVDVKVVTKSILTTVLPETVAVLADTDV